jgi:hypothetical protein
MDSRFLLKGIFAWTIFVRKDFIHTQTVAQLLIFGLQMALDFDFFPASLDRENDRDHGDFDRDFRSPSPIAIAIARLAHGARNRDRRSPSLPMAPAIAIGDRQAAPITPESRSIAIAIHVPLQAWRQILQ